MQKEFMLGDVVEGNDNKTNTGTTGTGAERVNLTFLESLTIQQFKERSKTSKIDVLRNPHTNKLFMVDEAGNILGGAKENFTEAPVVSRVKGPDGTESYLLHKKGEAAEVFATL
jgi:hypothetical protein